MKSAADVRDAVTHERPEWPIDVDEHVAFLREVVRRHVQQTTYESRLAAIERRAADPRLYLAVIGEFSSGKSTFVNALLRRRLLKASCAATTASITRISHGPELRVTASFDDDVTLAGTEQAFDALRARVLALQPDADAGSLEKVLELLTSEPAVANHVRDVDVVVSTKHLDAQTVILDTPGIGAGADDAAGHAELTQSVMAKHADCAVVLIPSTAPMSNTLVRFLDVHGRPFLPRCVFVITGADRHTAEERQRVRDFVQQQLRSQFGLADPPILFSAAIAMVPLPSLPEALKERWKEWRPKFVRLEAELKSALSHQRVAIVTERLARLIEAAMAEIGEDLSRRRAALDEEKTHLDAHSVTAIDIVLEALERSARTALQTAASDIKSRIASRKDVFRASTNEHIGIALNRGEWNADTYESLVAPKVRSVIEHYGREYGSEAAGHISKLRAAAAKVAREFARQFEENYRTLRALDLQISVPSITVGDLAVPAVSFQQSRPYIEQQQSSRRTGRNVGMAAGALIGGMLLAPLGPPGILLGAWIGRKSGGAISGDDLSALRSRLKSLIASDVTLHLNTCESAIRSRIDAITAAVLRQFNAAGKRHRTEYGEAVAELLRSHDERRKTVMREIRAARRDADELSHRASSLEALLQKLATKGGTDV